MGNPKSSSKSRRLDFSLLADEDSEDGIDLSSLAAVLSADYPLIDNTLIIALLSDYPPETIHKHVDEIRDQLGILEATIVPDPDDVQIVESEVDSTTDGGLEAKLDGFKIGDKVTPSSNGGSSASAKVSSKVEGSGSGSSDTKSTSPTSLHDDDGVEDELNLLTSLFPNTSTTTLKEALSSQISVPAAIDYLLSLEMIRDAEESGQWPDALLSEDETAGHSPLAVYSDKTPSSSAPVSRSSSRRRKKDKHIVPIVDTLQRRTVSRPASRPSSRTSSPSRARFSRPTDNTWHTIASLAAYLSELVPSQPQSYFLAYFHAPDHHSAYSAARASLAGLPQAASELEQSAEGVLNEIYGGYMLDQGMTEREKEAIQYDLKLCMNAAGGDVAGVMDLMDLLDEISLWPGDEDDFARYDAAPSIHHPAPQSRTPNSTTIPATPSSSTAAVPIKYANPDRLLARPKSKQPPPPTERIIPGSQPSTNHLIQTAHDDFGTPPSSPVPSSPKPLSGKQIHSQNWRTVSHARQHLPRALHPHASNIPAYSRGHLPNNPHPGSLFNSSSAVGPSIDDCLSRAAAERAKRELAIREAGRHFRGGSGGKAVSGAVAGHYALQAREAMAKAREWELKAARMVVQGQMDRSGGTTVDLHHLTINEAVTLSREAAQKWWKTQVDNNLNHQSRDRTPSRALTIVTGIGRHSAGQRGVLGPAVANALEVDGWRVDRGESGRGYLVVKGKRS